MQVVESVDETWIPLLQSQYHCCWCHGDSIIRTSSAMVLTLLSPVNLASYLTQNRTLKTAITPWPCVLSWTHQIPNNNFISAVNLRGPTCHAGYDIISLNHRHIITCIIHSVAVPCTRIRHRVANSLAFLFWSHYHFNYTWYYIKDKVVCVSRNVNTHISAMKHLIIMHIWACASERWSWYKEKMKKSRDETCSDERQIITRQNVAHRYVPNFISIKFLHTSTIPKDIPNHERDRFTNTFAAWNYPIDSKACRPAQNLS